MLEAKNFNSAHRILNIFGSIKIIIYVRIRRTYHIRILYVTIIFKMLRVSSVKIFNTSTTLLIL